jgi:esterase/lipase superfamily enzyme
VFDDGKIDFLGHGLGAELITRGCGEWLAANPGRRLGEVVLAAADIDTEVFTRSYAPRLSAAARRMTLYVVPDDTALAASRAVRAGPRVGATIVEIPGIDTIQVSDPNLGLMGHAYYATSSLVLRDLELLLRGITASERRLQRAGRHYTLR